MVESYIFTYSLLIIFFIIERFYRQGQEAKTLNVTASDKGTTQLISRVIVLSLILLLFAPILNLYQFGTLNLSIIFVVIGWIGMIFGIILRILAAKTLGKYYTCTLRISEEQTIIEKGIYRFIRHPGYLGNIILLIFAGISVYNYIVTVFIGIVILPAYLRRISREEALLIEKFGSNYIKYSQHTKMLIPFLI